MNNREIDEDYKIALEEFSGFLKPEEIKTLVLRHHGIPADIPKSKFIPSAPHTTIKQLKDVEDNTYVNIKGRVVKAVNEWGNYVVYITDMKEVVRCVLFSDIAIEKFKRINFKVGDRIKLKSIKVTTYNKKKELIANSYTSILKLKDKKDST